MIEIFYLCQSYISFQPAHPSQNPLKQEELQTGGSQEQSYGFKYCGEPTERGILSHLPGASNRTPSLGCGHSFCQTCITDSKETDISLEGDSSCPVCGARYSLGNLWPNLHLANIVERLRTVKLKGRGGAEDRSLCAP